MADMFSVVQLETPTGTMDDVLMITNTSSGIIKYSFGDILNLDGEYTFSCWMKTTNNITTDIGISKNKKSFPLTTTWSKIVYTANADVALSKEVMFTIPVGATLYAYNGQLEVGNLDTDFSINPDDLSSAISQTNNKVTTLETNFVIEQGKIETLIRETTIDNGDGTTTTLKDAYNQTKQTVDGNTTSIGNIQTKVNTLTGEVEEMNSSMLEIKETADGVSTIVTQNKATWDGAATKAETAQTTATQTAKKFNWIVKSGTNETDFTLTDRTASLVAENINLNGLVTFNGLNGETQDKINNGDNANTTIEAWGKDEIVHGTTTINGGYIKTNSITSDFIDVNELFANVAVIDKITSYKIRAEQIDAGLINANMLDIYGLVVRQKDTNVETLAIDTKGDITMRGSIESYNYVGGKTGWSIKSNGDAEFNDVTVRGDLIGNFGGIMSVGGSGENLFSGFSYNQEIQLTDYQGVGSFTVASQLSGHLTFDPATTVGKTYTISFYAKSPNGETPLQLYNRNSLPRYFYIPTTVIDTALSTEWKYYTYTFVNTDMGESYSTDPTYVNRIEIYAPNQLGVLVKNIKVEEGYVATPWSPAINDTHKEIVFWAGSGYDQREYAPYRVYSDGSVISTRGTFSGVWTGEIEIGNISIIDPSKTSGNDAILTIQHGETGVKRVQLRDTDESTFAQNIIIQNTTGTNQILLINDGTVNVTNQYIVGDTTIADKNVKLGDGYLKYLDTTLSIVASNVALGSSGGNIQVDVYGNQTVHGNMIANKDILFANGWFIKQSSLGLDISVNES